jgi:hypothetical protein
MKKAGSILILSLLFAFSSRAQLTFIDSTKNEIGINIDPLLPSLGIPANSDFMTLQFKHHYTNVSLRVGISGIDNSTYDETNPRNYHFKQTDSFTILDHYYDTKNSVRLNIGLEQQQMLKNKWKFFYGFDLLGGVTNEESSLERNTYRLKPDSSFAPYHYSNDSIISSVNHVLVGAAFIAGFDYFFSKRISLGIQGYFPISFEFQTGNSKSKTSSLSFDQNLSIMIRMHL